MGKSNIEWTDMTWNPVIGCHKISPGCDNCYAEKMANRISHMDNAAGEAYRHVITDGKWNWDTYLVENNLGYLTKLKKGRKIFVGSMTDLFMHSQSAQGTLDVILLFSIMARYPQHTFQILTKRPHEMKIFTDDVIKMGEIYQKLPYGGLDYAVRWQWPLPNVWLGVTVCNQEEANFKIPILLDTPAVCRFVSIEPMLGPIDLTCLPQKYSPHTINGLTGIFKTPHDNMRFMGLDWVIVGGETGPGAREMKPDWPRDIWVSCIDTATPLFFKKWGSHENTTCLDRVPWLELFKQFPTGSPSRQQLKD